MAAQDDELHTLISEEEEEEEQGFVRRMLQKYGYLCFNLFLVCIYILVGALVVTFGFNRRFITGLYFVTQIITTIGYGDITVPPEERLFITFYVFFGFAIVANIINGFITAYLDSKAEMMRREMRELEAKGSAAIEDAEEARRKCGNLNELASATVFFVVFLLLGTCFYAWFEACTCSYGGSFVMGCNMTSHEVCVNSGGITKSWVDCLYMSMITMTTIGFGDMTPMSAAGRWIGLPWMLVAVLAAGNFASSLSSYMDYMTKKPHGKKFTRELFKKIDKDGNNWLSRGEFYAWALVTKGLVSAEDIDMVDRVFRALDENKKGQIAYETLAARFGLVDDETDDESSEEDLMSARG